MTTPAKTQTAKVPAPATKRAAPAPEPVKAPTRNDMLARLLELGYDGPTSYTATTIREELLPWVEAGCPADPKGPVPSGALGHVHPAAKPERAPYRSKGYLAAMTEVREMLASGATLKALTAHLDEVLKEDPTA